jgi:hypothetical protein
MNTETPPEQFEQLIKLENIFMPEARRQRNRLYDNGRGLKH